MVAAALSGEQQLKMRNKDPQTMATSVPEAPRPGAAGAAALRHRGSIQDNPPLC